MTEYRCPHCGKADTLNHFTADGLYSYFCDPAEFGCGAAGPFADSKEAALEAFFNPMGICNEQPVESIGEENERLRKRITILEDILWEFVSASVEHYKDAPDSADTWPVQIDRDLVNRAVKALENESD